MWIPPIPSRTGAPGLENRKIKGDPLTVAENEPRVSFFLDHGPDCKNLTSSELSKCMEIIHSR
jgi:hypothetical protein